MVMLRAAFHQAAAEACELPVTISLAREFSDGPLNSDRSNINDWVHQVYDRWGAARLCRDPDNRGGEDIAGAQANTPTVCLHLHRSGWPESSRRGSATGL